MLESITHAFVSVGLLLGSLFGLYHEPTRPALVESSSPTFAAAVQNIAGATYTLAGGGISSSATSLTLSSLTLPQNGYAIQDADLSTTFYLTLEPGNRSRQEVISCTTVGTNTGSSVTISGCTRGLSPIYPYTASSSMQFAHAGGTQVIFSDPPQLFNQYLALDNDATVSGDIVFTGQTTFSVFPVTPSNSPASETVAGVVEIATGAELSASTQNGGIGRLAIGATSATSTYNAGTAANVVPVTNSLGHIDAGFVSSSTNFSVTATSTLATTTQIGAFNAWAGIGKQRQVITTTGTSSFAVPSGVTKVYVRVVGAGGAGAGATDNTAGAGAGGGGGGYSEEWVDVSGTSSIQVFVGTGATGDSDGGATGAWSTFGTNGFYLSAAGGAGGSMGVGVSSPGGAGGCGSGGDVNACGSAGGSATADSSEAIVLPGVGGGTALGGGGITGTNTAGGAGANYGGGGGGAATTAAGDQSGGSGAQGIVIINW